MGKHQKIHIDSNSSSGSTQGPCRAAPDFARQYPNYQTTLPYAWLVELVFLKWIRKAFFEYCSKSLQLQLDGFPHHWCAWVHPRVTAMKDINSILPERTLSWSLEHHHCSLTVSRLGRSPFRGGSFFSLKHLPDSPRMSLIDLWGTFGCSPMQRFQITTKYWSVEKSAPIFP